MKKRGISPVIATVLLIAIVLVVALIIFLWFKGLTQEAITKNLGGGEQNVDLVCNDVDFDASYSNNELFISNVGTVPIFNMKVKIPTSSGGDYETKDLGGTNGIDENYAYWPNKGLNQGGTFSIDISGESINSGTTITLIPVLLGKSNEGQKTFVCDEKRHGYEIDIL